MCHLDLHLVSRIALPYEETCLHSHTTEQLSKTKYDKDDRSLHLKKQIVSLFPVWRITRECVIV